MVAEVIVRKPYCCDKVELRRCFFYVRPLNPTCSSLLHCGPHAQVFGIIFTICQGKIIDGFGTLPGNIFLCVFLLIGAILTGEARGENGVTASFRFDS